jgi:multiple sugar transport system substrate-binding protein
VKTMKKSLTALSALTGISLVAVIAGCAAPAPGAEGKTTLTYWMTGTDDDALVMQAAAELYSEQNEDVTVKVQAIPWADSHAKILAAATSQTGPDIISGGMSWGIEFGALGGMIDLASHGIDDIEASTPEGIWNSITSSDGEVFAMPLDVATSVYLYRPDLLEAAGVDVPGTWEDLQAAIPELTASGIRYPFVENWGTFSVQDYANYLFQAGGDFYTAECKAGGLDTPEALAALEMWASVFQSPAPKQTIDAATALADGSAAIVQDESGALKLYETRVPELEGLWELAPVPAGPAGTSSFVGGRVTGVMAHAENPEAAVDFVKFLYTPEAIEAMQKQAAENGSLWVPANAEAVRGLDLPEGQADILAAAIDAGNAGPNCEGWGAVVGDVGLLLQSVVTDGADPEDALEQANALLDQGLQG